MFIKARLDEVRKQQSFPVNAIVRDANGRANSIDISKIVNYTKPKHDKITFFNPPQQQKNDDR